MSNRNINTKLQESSVVMSASQASTNTATVDNIDSVDITAVVAGSSPVGSIKLQKNNSLPRQTAVWVDLLDGEIQGAAANSVAISTAATFNWSVPSCTAREIRVFVTFTSGTITADITLHGKAT